MKAYKAYNTNLISHDASYSRSVEDILFYNHITSKTRICEIDVTFDDETGTDQIEIIRELDRNEIIEHVTSSQCAYNWALNIGNRDIMIDRVTESKWAYNWALNIGNRDIMIERVTEAAYILGWAMVIGDKDIMIDRLDNSSERCIDYRRHSIENKK